MSNQLNEYVKRPTNVKSELAEVMDRRQNEKIQELDNIKLDAMIAEEKKKLQELSPAKIDSSQATNFISTFFAGKTPAEIKEIIRSLTQEEIDKFIYMAKSMNQNSYQNSFDPRGLPPRDSNSEVKNMLEALKIGLEAGRKNDNGSISTKDLLDALKTGAELSKAQQPANPQPDIQYKMLEGTMAEIKAIREDASRQDRLRTEKEITELKNRPSALQELSLDSEKYQAYKKMWGGTDSNVINEWALKKLDMEQNKDIEDRKQTWEEKKWALEQENSGKQLEQIGGLVKTVSEGPVAQVLAILGKRGKEQIRGSETPSSNASQAPPVQIVKVDCPSCKGSFPANSQLTKIQCPLCGEQLQNSNVPVAPEEQIQVPVSTQLASNPAQEQIKSPAQEKPTDQTVEVESPVEQITKQ